MSQFLKAGSYASPDAGDEVCWLNGQKPSVDEYLQSVENAVWVIAKSLPENMDGVIAMYRYEHGWMFEFDRIQRPDLWDAVQPVFDRNIDATAVGDEIENVDPRVVVGHFGHDHESEESWIY